MYVFAKDHKNLENKDQKFHLHVSGIMSETNWAKISIYLAHILQTY